MATKHTDGCFQRAEDDEPLFTLLARDATAPNLVELWADLRAERDGETEQVREARECARQMREWRAKNRPQKTPTSKPEKRTCNRHSDCDEADRLARERGARAASHCHDDCCEECFGS